MKTTCLLLLPLFFTSCATITRGVHEKLTVLSEPSGAHVVLSSGETGVTPTKFVKTRRDNFTVTVSKPGFIAQSVRVESKASATGETAMAGNAVLGGLIGIGIDATSGAYNSLYPNPVSVRLLPVGKSAPAAEMQEHSGRPSSTTKGSSPEVSPTPE
jgi:PEGA domain